ncbi:MAG: D-glycero-beta-D-manno-heptose-7-phosphate kinase [Planctomycetes bacterium]|nr:D-glycero-beta-D-manno-heptose-7-phosphate kinase [Planctomycetota bacterium]
MKDLINKLGSPRIMVVGDIILDKYIYGTVNRISPEAPIQILNAQHEELRLGGAANVAHNLVTLGARASICGVIGGDDPGRAVKTIARNTHINTGGLFIDPARTTPVKTRLIAHNQQVLRVDNEKPSPVYTAIEQRLIKYLKANIKNYDAILVSDYNKGTLTNTLLKTLTSLGRAHRKPIIIDPKGKDYRKYYRATAITPNRQEAELATGIEITDAASRRQAARELVNNAKLDFVIITLGEKGLYLLDKKGKEFYDPARPLRVYDVTGAGDTVLATLGIAFAGGLNYTDALHLANLAAGVVVSKVGTATVTRQEIIEHYRNLNDSVSGNKLVSLKELSDALKNKRPAGNKIVFTNGCFDILHPGHIATLEFASSQGDILVVGLNSDKSVQRIKGPGRPIMNQAQRAGVLAGLAAVDYIVLFDEPTPIKLIKAIKPDVLVKGADWKQDKIVGRQYVAKVLIVPLVKGLSTTDIIKRIKRATDYTD